MSDGAWPGRRRPGRCYGRAIHWPQDALKRAAAAIREASSDTFVLARRALEAAIRSEAALLVLLPAVSPVLPRTHRVQACQPQFAARAIGKL
jgi:hypothetical protein